MDPTEPILAAGIVVIWHAPDGDRLLLLRNRGRREWGFPKGHADPGEDALTTARRELAEETGISDFSLLDGFRFVSQYAIPSGPRRGRRKEVTYFLASVPNNRVAISNEHDEARWITAVEVDSMLPFGDLRRVARDAFRHLQRSRS